MKESARMEKTGSGKISKFNDPRTGLGLKWHFSTTLYISGEQG
jgi:hypothetical protein